MYKSAIERYIFDVAVSYVSDEDKCYRGMRRVLYSCLHIESNCRLIAGLLCRLCLCSRLTADMLNEEIVHNYFESVFIIIIAGSLFMKGGYLFLFINYINVLVFFLSSSLLTRRFNSIIV